MVFPSYGGKHDHEAFVTPQAVLAHRRARGFDLVESVPPAIIVTYQPQLFAAVLDAESTTPLPVGGPAETVHALDRTDGRVGVVGGFGIGAPVVAVVVEELIALGAREIVSVGVAGSLRPELLVGDVVVADEAIRDEGVSHHYLRADTPALADLELSDRLEFALAASRLRPCRGPTWTIDAIYRETVAEARHFAERGALCVEMEAAALFAIGIVRRAALAAVLCISDSLAGAEWAPQYDSERLARRLWAAFHTTVDCLDGRPFEEEDAAYSYDGH
ncbi:MAG TPA: nucleoside phosphorylase [Acidimicrobiales bacterium]